MTSFKIGEISEEFYKLSNEVLALMASNGEQYDVYRQEIEQNLQELEERKLLMVSFIGQYSAGKSTIISALTGNRNIKIDADIATDAVESYLWNGIALNDTPGLYTNRIDHDDITYEALKKSDLLVYCITSDLFDNIILENFKKLAYEQSYKGKMILVVNKMSMEAGDFDELQKNYMETLRKSFEPHNIEEFNICFIDAADYIEGTEDEIEELIDVSNFIEFIKDLNLFVEKKGYLGKLDTPIRIVISEIDKARTELITDTETKQFLMLLDRFEHRVKRSIKVSQLKVNQILSEMHKDIVEIGSRLSEFIVAGVTEVDFEREQKCAVNDIEKVQLRSIDEIDSALEEELHDLINEFEGIMNSELARTHFSGLENEKVTIEQLQQVNIKDLSNLQRNFLVVSNLSEKASKGVLKLAGIDTNGLKSIRASDVAGSQLHEGVTKIGHFFGQKFKPWGAVNIGKNVANVMQKVGPALAVAGVVLQIAGDIQENRDLKKIAKAKSECVTAFKGVAEQLEMELQKVFVQHKEEYYNKILEDISATRNERVMGEENKSVLNEQLNCIRQRLEQLILTIEQ